MYIGEGHDLLVRLFSGIFSLQTLYIFACTIALCVVFQVVMRARQKKVGSVKYFAWVYVFLLYLMLVYIQTGVIGAAWWLRSPLIPMNRIYLVPFSTSPDIVPYVFNVLMTMPLGFLVPLIWPRFRSLKVMALVGLAFSFTIEFVQLFSLRVTSVDDLIMNTLGAVLGYGIFVCYSRWFIGKKKSGHDVSNGRGGYEALVYLLLSLIGVVFLHHPVISRHLPYPSQGGTIVVDHFIADIDSTMVTDALLGVLLEVTDTGIRLQKTESYDASDETVIGLIDDEMIIIFGDEVTFTILSGSWRNPRETPATVTDLSLEDLLNIYGYYNEEGQFIAKKIVISRLI